MDVRTNSRLINIFNGVTDTNCNNVVEIKDVLKAIKSGRWKDEIEWYRQEEDKEERELIKKKFPAVTFSGTFIDRRLDRNLEYHTGILVVDIDKKDMTMDYEKTMGCVQRSPFIFCAFESPSNGIKALAWISEDPKDHILMFKGIEEYFMDEYGIFIDKSGKNPSRLCFISWDPEMYYDVTDLRIFDVEKDSPKNFLNEKEKDYQEVKGIDYSKYKTCYDIRHIISVAKKRASEGVGAYQRGNRNNYVFYISCILNRAGVEQFSAIEVLNDNYPSLGMDELAQTVKSAYRRYPEDFGTKPIKVKDNGQKPML